MPITILRFTQKLPIIGLLALFTFSLLIVVWQPKQASAISGADFSAGQIIDNDVFTNLGTMSVQDIQNFLNSKVPSCDTNGTKQSTHTKPGGGYYTRAEWGAKYNSDNNTNIAAAPYVCLKNYVENPSTQQNNLQNPSANISGGISSAQIIYNAAQQYSINPQVLITTLQKEQGLVTDEWPWTRSYQSAMGYGCPDTSACSTLYYGFANQVTNAAKQFRRYFTNPSNYNYVPGNNYIGYNPNASCGGSNVNVLNQATASLYNYTPYQPNTEALNNLQASGNSCSAYGNRNFWYYFNSWFGSSVISTDYTDYSNTQNRTKTVSFNGRLYVFYYNAYQRTIQYGTQNTTTGQWEFSVLDGNSSAGGGRINASLGSTIDVVPYGNSLQAFYYDKTNGVLRHAWMSTSGTWQFETLDGSSNSVSHRVANVGINPTVLEYKGSLQLYYYDKSNGNLRHGWSDINGWHFENLDGDRGSVGGKDSDIGLTSSIMQYGDDIQLYYYDVDAGNIRHAWADPNGWHFENLDGESNSVSRKDANVGRGISMVNFNGSIQLYYYDVGAGNLRHGWSDARGWHFENLDGDRGSVGGKDSDIGTNPVVTILDNSLQVFYYDSGDNNLRHAWTSSQGWRFENLDGDTGSVSKTGGDIGSNPTVTMYDTSLQLYYFNRSSGTLRHAWADANGWHFEDLASVVVY